MSGSGAYEIHCSCTGQSDDIASAAVGFQSISAVAIFIITFPHFIHTVAATVVKHYTREKEGSCVFWLISQIKFVLYCFENKHTLFLISFGTN